MTDPLSIDGYIPEGHKPNSTTQRELLADAYRQMIKPYPSVRLPNWPRFNLMTGGFRANEYTILAGSTGSGKTTFCANISAELSESNIPHYVASIETGPNDFVRRVMSAVRRRDWNTGEQVPLEDVKQFHVDYGAKLERDNVWLGLYENRVRSEVMLADIAFHVKTHGIKVALVDNFQFMNQVVSTSNQIVEEDRVMHSFIMFCKLVPVHILMINHPRKTESGRVETEFDVKGSSTAVQEAQNVLLWNRIHPDLVKSGVANEGDRELKIAKMRRRGKFVGKKLIFRAVDSVHYQEVDVV